MPEPLPPLNAIRAFEAAARHLSITRAAEELFVTHGAISRQVKNLEEYLKKKLFVRRPRSLILTAAGEAYAELATEILDKLAAETRRLMHGETREKLTVSVIPSFASRWLVPRLSRFYEQHSHWEIMVNATLELVDFERDKVDLAIRFGRGRWQGVASDYLFSSDFVPVCAPGLMDGEYPLREPGDIRYHRLLHTDTREQWTTWLRLADVQGVDVIRDPLYTDANITIQAAIEGRGIALANRRLVMPELNSGRLMTPFALSLSDDVAYYVVYPRGGGHLAKIKTIRDWLLAEARASELETGINAP
ncbi:MAG: transcriptional regulator GcvA [Acidobacteriota bacterium]|nr:transcriptional regulator GcvA [Acidobacteriota bacterium]